MADVVFVLIVVAFFGLCVLYVLGCERLISRGGPTDVVSDAEPEKAAR